jgi:hypothetical protein
MGGAVNFRSLALDGAALLVILTCNVSSGLAQTSPDTPRVSSGVRDGNTIVGNFYRHGDITEVPVILASWVNTRAPPPPMLGFIAGVAAKYPDRIDQMFSPSIGENERRMAVYGVRMGRSVERARELASRLDIPESQFSKLDFGATLLERDMMSPSAHGMLWGASFATGNPRYVQRILDQYVAIANRSDINIDDIIHSIRIMPGYSADIIAKIKQAQGDKAAFEVWLAANALWTLEQNSSLHDFVKVLVEAYLSAHPETPASAAFRRVREVSVTTRGDCAVSPGNSGCLTAF